ncbi:MAG: hypothetical protein U0X91_17705 [Spirosomataceae bacterium]
MALRYIKISVLMLLTALGFCFQSQSYKSYNCSELNISFKLPIDFSFAEDKIVNDLEKKGNQAEKEAFPNARTRTWQPTCLKTLITPKKEVFSILTILKDVLVQDHKSYENFLDYYFQEQKYFLGSRLKSKGLVIEKMEEKNENVKLAGKDARKIKLTFTVKGSKIIYLTYLLLKNKYAFQLTYVGKNTDFTKLVEVGIESSTFLK